MNELIIVIILEFMLVIIHFVCLIIILNWRRKKYSKQIHTTGTGLIFFIFSLFVFVISVIGTHLIFKNLMDGIKLLFASLLLCSFSMIIAVRDFCFCIFIKGTDVILRTLTKEIKIDLSSTGTIIDEQSTYGYFKITIISESGNHIQFNRRKVSGNVNEFLRTCKSIHIKNNS